MAWFAVEPLDMRAGVDNAMARVVSVFGEARSHHAYLFLNRRANRLKVSGARWLWPLAVRAASAARTLHPSEHRSWPTHGAVEQPTAGARRGAAVGAFERTREDQRAVEKKARAILLATSEHVAGSRSMDLPRNWHR